MSLRKSLLALILCLFALNAFSATATEPVAKTPIAISAEQAKQVEALLKDFSAHDLSRLTISKVEELTGKKMSFKEKVAFKIAKMKMKKLQKKVTVSMESSNGFTAPGIDKGIYILLAIVGFPWLSVGLASDWEGNDWLYCLLLTFLCWLPGFIYALVKMKKYYA
ncbi:MAG: YqaE/Pmp3 family membrane protein [Saprospiraceae bacterium]|nr:YqaE/Pmp3 family membrane protein [Saprospiraceae bacterium]